MIKVLTESRKVFTDKDNYEIIVSANKRTTGCTITCFDNNGNPNSYYLEKLYKDLMTQVVHLDQLNGILEVSAPFNKVLSSLKKINGISEINESVDEIENEVTPVSPAVEVPVDSMQDIPANTTDAASKIAEEGDFEECKVDYTDPKYQKIIDYLNKNGYPGSKFLGKMGFYIPQNTSYVSILFDDIFTECSIMTTRFRLSPSGASDYMSELAQVIPVVDAINAILADATTAETKDRHVSESVEYNNKIIENGSQNFGKPGTYLVYRNGEHQTKRGFISFADTKAGADKYAQNGRKTEKFVVTISNPYVSKGNSSYEAFANAYKDLVGTDPVIDPSVEKINDAWRKYDSEIAKQLVDKGYDSIIYIVPQNNEVNVLGADIDKMHNINEYNESVPQALGTE